MLPLSIGSLVLALPEYLVLGDFQESRLVGDGKWSPGSRVQFKVDGYVFSGLWWARA